MEAFCDNPIFITVRNSVLCELGGGTGPACCTATSCNHYWDIRTGDATGFDHRPANPDHNQGSRTGRNSDATDSDEPSSNAHGSGATSQSEYADGAVSHNGRYSKPEWKSDGDNSIGYGSSSASAIGSFSAGRAKLELSGNTIE